MATEKKVYFFNRESAEVSLVSEPRDKARTVYSLVNANSSSAQGLEMGLERVEVGAEIPLHSHNAAEEVIFLISGRARVHIADQTKEVGAGEVLFLPKNTPHRIQNIGDEPLWITYTFSPPVGLKLSH